MLCVYFKESQQANIAPVVGIAQSTYALVALLFLMVAMCVRSVILISVAIALAMENARKYGERRWTCEIDEL